MAKPQALSQTLATYSMVMNVVIASLLIFVGFYLLLYGLGNFEALIKIVSVILIIAGIKRFLDMLTQSMMGKELEKLEKMLKDRKE